MNAKTTRTVWTNGEKNAVFAAMVEFFAQDPRAPAKMAMQRAQLVLDMPRRVVVTDQRIHTYRSRIEEARRKAAERPGATSIPPAPPEPAPTPTENLGDLLERLLDRLADRVADRIAERLAVQVEVQTQTTSTPFRPRHNPEPVSQPRQCRPGVLILGIQPYNASTIQREFAHRFDIRCYDSDEAGKRVVHPMAHVVLMTKFVNHSIQERWRKSGMLHRCNGGVSELREILANL